MVCARMLEKKAEWVEGRDVKVTLIDGHHLTRSLTKLISIAENDDRNESVLVLESLKQNLGKMKFWPGIVV